MSRRDRRRSTISAPSEMLRGASGIYLGVGGSIVNGSAASTKASIIGGSGTTGNAVFVLSGSASIVNFGKIGGGRLGVDFGSDGTVGATAL